MERLRLTDGYDRGGAYWGLRPERWKLYFAQSVEEHDLPSGYCAAQRRGLVEMSTWAPDREAAKTHIRLMLPNAKFLR